MQACVIYSSSWKRYRVVTVGKRLIQHRDVAPTEVLCYHWDIWFVSCCCFHQAAISL